MRGVGGVQQLSHTFLVWIAKPETRWELLNLQTTEVCMARHVKSTDPRKPAIVAALKKKAGGTKVTNLEELADGSGFRGDVLRPLTTAEWDAKYPGEGRRKRGWMNLGTFEVSNAEAGQ
jgi:hypothetical protein